MRCVGSSPAAALSAFRNRVANERDRLEPQIYDEDSDDEDAVDIEPSTGFETDPALLALVNQAEELVHKPDPKLAALIDALTPLIRKGVNPVVFCRYLATAVPPTTICGDKVPTIDIGPDPRDQLLWLGVANSLAMDFIVRKKVSLKMSFTVMDSLPFPRDFDQTPAAAKIAHYVCALCAVGPDMADFRDQAIEARILSSHDEVIEDPARRAEIAAEIDMLVAREVYGLTKQEMLYILDPINILGKDCGIETFKALRNAELREFKEFRSARLIMEAWDRLDSAAIRGAA